MPNGKPKQIDPAVIVTRKICNSGIMRRGDLDQALPMADPEIIKALAMRGIAHDLKNAIAAGSVAASFIKDEIPNNEDLEIVISAFDQLRDLISALYEITNSNPGEHLHGNVMEALARAKKLANPDRYGIVVDDIPDAPLPVCMPTAEITRVLTNILTNAREASERTAAVVIRIVNQVHEGRAGVAISVMDRGCGMRSHELAQAGEPGFSTKERESGFGLNVVSTLIKRYGGTWDIHSSIDRGTTVIIFIPASPA